MNNGLFIFLMLLVCGCNEKIESVTIYSGSNLVSRTTVTSEGDRVRIVTIDGCEYIKNDVYSGFVYTHKGDCKNPIHIYKETK